MNSVIPGAAYVVQNFGESRLMFEGVEEAKCEKPGIKFHSPFTAVLYKIAHAFFKIFGYTQKIIDIQDIDGKVYHINREELRDWLGRNSKSHVKTSGLLNTPNVRDLSVVAELKAILLATLYEKSPQPIIEIWKLKRAYIKKEIAEEEFINQLVELKLKRTELLSYKIRDLPPIKNAELITHLKNITLPNGEKLPQGQTTLFVKLKEDPSSTPSSTPLASQLKGIYNNDNVTLTKTKTMRIELVIHGDNFYFLNTKEKDTLKLDWTKDIQLVQKVGSDSI